MDSIVKKISDSYKKSAVVDVRSGDTVKVHQKIREGNKERVQIFLQLRIPEEGAAGQDTAATKAPSPAPAAKAEAKKPEETKSEGKKKKKKKDE